MRTSESELVGLALELGAEELGPLAAEERACVAGARAASRTIATQARRAIARGEDPLGDAFCQLRSRDERRPMGATYTPRAMVDAMIAWGALAAPVRVVDPGAGSGRFAVAAGRAFPGAEIVAVEMDPVASLLTRGHLVAAKLGRRARVVFDDYRRLELPRVDGATLFVGNPPYVRHHGIAPSWKRWLTIEARKLGLKASQLAGLHVHFFLATALFGRPGDAGVFLTASEWLDVNYGSLVRELLVGPLGVTSVHVLEPTSLPFADADTTAAITCFTLGARPATVHLRQVKTLDAIARPDGGHAILRERLASATRWTPLTRARAMQRRPSGLVELGEICRVHRGQVTGANAVWIAGAHSDGVPLELLFPSVTRARELFAAGDALEDLASLKRVIDLPAELDLLDASARRAVERFLRAARSMGADRGFVAQNRKAWWSVGLRKPAPILATYMARRPPAFVRNLAGARHINIAHGLYPREPMSDAALDALARYLGRATVVGEGRTYAGGLTKFEPGEMERILVPSPA
ncbi:MAG: class I SAM-dependent methyltransferase [Polyangiaceae bacterium]